MQRITLTTKILSLDITYEVNHLNSNFNFVFFKEFCPFSFASFNSVFVSFLLKMYKFVHGYYKDR